MKPERGRRRQPGHETATAPRPPPPWHGCSNGCYISRIARDISVRDLRNHTAQVIAAVRAGERLSLTVNRTPVADIVPHELTRTPWVPSETLREIVQEAGADAGLLEDLAPVRDAVVDDG